MTLHHAAIICSTVKSLEFYSLLGFTITSRIVREERNDEIVWMELNGITLEIFIDNTHPERVNNPEANGLRHLAFKVDDVDIYHSSMREYNPEPIRIDPITGERLFFVKDLDGLPIEIRE